MVRGGGTLSVTVHRAVGLRLVQKDHVKQSPYVRVRLSEVGEKRSTVDSGGGTEPVWYKGPFSQGNVLTFDLPSELLGAKSTLELGVQIWSKNLLRDKLIGEVKVDWLAAVAGQAVQSYPLVYYAGSKSADGCGKGNKKQFNSIAPTPSTSATATSGEAGNVILSMSFTPIEQYRRKAQETALQHRWNDPHDRTVSRPPGASTKWGMQKIGRVAPIHYSRRVNMRARTSTIWS